MQSAVLPGEGLIYNSIYPTYVSTIFLIQLRPSLFVLFTNSKRLFNFCFQEKYGGRRHGYLHRHPPGNHLASSWCLSQVWLPGGVLDLFVTDHLGLSPWDYLCCLCHHQVVNFIILWRSIEAHLSFGL